MRIRPLGKMDKVIIYAAAAILIFIAFSGEDENKSPKQKTAPAHKSMAAADKSASPPAARSSSAVWPPQARGKIEMAKNLEAANYLIVFDGSGSMSERQCSGNSSKIDVAKEAVARFIASLSPEDNVGLVGFGLTRYKKKRSSLFDHDFVAGDRTGVLTTLKSVAPMGNTPLRLAMEHGFRMLERQAQRQGGYGRYHMVIITDGIGTDGDPSVTAKRIVGSSVVRIHVIGFCLDGKHQLDVPGYTRYSTANDPQALEKGLQGVLAEADQFDPGVFIQQ